MLSLLWYWGLDDNNTFFNFFYNYLIKKSNLLTKIIYFISNKFNEWIFNKSIIIRILYFEKKIYIFDWNKIKLHNNVISEVV